MRVNDTKERREMRDVSVLSFGHPLRVCVRPLVDISFSGCSHFFRFFFKKAGRRRRRRKNKEKNFVFFSRVAPK